MRITLRYRTSTSIIYVVELQVFRRSLKNDGQDQDRLVV